MGRLLIELPSEQRDGRSPYGLILLITTLYGLAPFAVYALARLSGDLPSYASWRELSNGLGNHGPWRYTSWQRPLIHFSTVMLLVVLPLFTLVAGLVSRYGSIRVSQRRNVSM